MSTHADKLSARQREVADLLKLGWSNKDIASSLGIATATAIAHVKRIMDLLGADNRTQAAAILIDASYRERLSSASLMQGFEGWTLGRAVRAIDGPAWRGRIVGFCCSSLEPRSACVESDREPGNVRIIPIDNLHREDKT